MNSCIKNDIKMRNCHKLNPGSLPSVPCYYNYIERESRETKSLPVILIHLTQHLGEVIHFIICYFCLQLIILFLLGGHNGVSHLRSVERFDPVSSEWTMVAPMSHPRTGLSVAVLNGLLYAVGGHDGSGYLSLVQCYDPHTKTWHNVKSMCSSRCSFGIATL